jgi:hypothetical protein
MLLLCVGYIEDFYSLFALCVCAYAMVLRKFMRDVHNYNFNSTVRRKNRIKCTKQIYEKQTCIQI